MKDTSRPRDRSSMRCSIRLATLWPYHAKLTFRKVEVKPQKKCMCKKVIEFT